MRHESEDGAFMGLAILLMLQGMIWLCIGLWMGWMIWAIPDLSDLPALR